MKTLPMRFIPLSSFFRHNPFLYAAPLPALVYFASMSTSSPATANGNNGPPSVPNSPPFPTRPYISRHKAFPYTPADFTRADESEDESFYSTPRFVTHIDDHAISVLKRYYAAELPRKGRILDLCSSWISHFPAELEARARHREKAEKEEEQEEGELQVIGLGMNARELAANPILSSRPLQNLNIHPTIPPTLAPLAATTCVVSIDYLTDPLAVLASIHAATQPGGRIHLVVSNRCFPTKAVARWLRCGEQERLNMVGEYLWWSGWTEVEVVELCDGSVGEGETSLGEGERLKGGMAELFRTLGMGGGRVDPLWVVRGVKKEAEEERGKEEAG